MSSFNYLQWAKPSEHQHVRTYVLVTEHPVSFATFCITWAPPWLHSTSLDISGLFGKASWSQRNRSELVQANCVKLRRPTVEGARYSSVRHWLVVGSIVLVAVGVSDVFRWSKLSVMTSRIACWSSEMQESSTSFKLDLVGWGIQFRVGFSLLCRGLLVAPVNYCMLCPPLSHLRSCEWVEGLLQQTRSSRWRWIHSWNGVCGAGYSRTPEVWFEEWEELWRFPTCNWEWNWWDLWEVASSRVLPDPNPGEWPNYWEAHHRQRSPRQW